MWSTKHLPKYSNWARHRPHRKRSHCFLIYSITLCQFITQGWKSFSYQCMGWMEGIPRLMQIETINSLWLQVQGVNRVSPASWATLLTMSQPRLVRYRPLASHTNPIWEGAHSSLGILITRTCTLTFPSRSSQWRKTPWLHSPWNSQWTSSGTSARRSTIVLWLQPPNISAWFTQRRNLGGKISRNPSIMRAESTLIWVSGKSNQRLRYLSRRRSKNLRQGRTKHQAIWTYISPEGPLTPVIFSQPWDS
jgi:hypothetical protein